MNSKHNQYRPNPQGKGLVPLLQGIKQQATPAVLVPKQIDQVEMELFTSLFVLQSAIKFNPVVGASYWLYRNEQGFKLLMVSPQEWVRPYQGVFIGECVLQKDRTWTVSLGEEIGKDDNFINYLNREKQKLKEMLISVDTIDEAMPVYVESFSFYARILAFSLGKSLSASMQLSGIKSLNYQQARGFLGYEERF